MLKVGIVGLPNAGKSTTFNTLSGAEAVVAPYPFSTIEPNRTMLKLRDSDFTELGVAIDAPDLQYSELELWDIAGIIEGASQGEGLGNEFLGQMKDCNVLLHVVRVQDGDSVAGITKDIAVVDKEVALFDHKLLNKPFEKARRLAKLFPKDKSHTELNYAVTIAYNKTKNGERVVDALPLEAAALLCEFDIVSLKEKVLIANTDGSISADDTSRSMNAALVVNMHEVGQLVDLNPDEQQELGYHGTEVSQTIEAFGHAVLKAASMKQFYTVGHLGVGQWIIDEQANAEECANLIHAELGSEVKTVKVAQINDFRSHKSWVNLAKNGLVKSYGASKYIPANKEVLKFE